MPRYPIALLGLFVTLLATTPVLAQSGSTSAFAGQLFDEGQRLAAQGDYAAACPKLAESQRLDPQLGTMLHLADCYSSQGKVASAWGVFRDAVEIAEQRGDPRAVKARVRVVELESQVPRLVINVAQPTPSMEVRHDNEVLGSPVWGTAMPVDPGQHMVSASAPGYQPWSTKIELRADGRTVRVDVPPLTPSPAQAPPPTTPTPPPVSPPPSVGPAVSPPPPNSRADSRSHGSALRTTGFVTGGVGLVVLGFGAAFGFETTSKINERDGVCPERINCTDDDFSRSGDLTDEAESSARVANILYVAGALVTGTGIALVLAGSSKSKRAAVALQAQPWVSGHAVGTTLGARF